MKNENKRIFDQLTNTYLNNQKVETLDDVRFQIGLMEGLMSSFYSLFYKFNDELDFESARQCQEWHNICDQTHEVMTLIERLHIDEDHSIEWLDAHVDIQYFTTRDGHQSWCAVL